MKKSTLEQLLMGGRDRPMVSILDGTVTSTDPYLVLCTGEDEPGEVIPVGKGAVGDAVIVLCIGRRRLAFPGTQLAVPDPPTDTGWQPLELMSGFTGDIAPQWRVRDGWAMLRGRVTRTAGNWTNSNYQFAVTPAAALPTRLLYTVAVARGGYVLTAAIDHRLQITSAAATAEVHLESIPPWRVD